ncbi:MAG: dNTP triphosphohydrolase [Deltaproteobacteria bacterium]|nr:dNTP triphosphohydrolase [Deltaproteobacteria bacterium]
MNWNQLLSSRRLGYPEARGAAPHDSRNQFEQDYSRVVFSSAVRRLQDKAQVFPLESTGYVRTRLSHSMEVSSLARSLGTTVERELMRRGLLEMRHVGSMGAILATAGLIHDLGNPPFGHYGEEVIQRYYTDRFRLDGLGLAQAQQEDLRRFDGNAQALRYISKVHYMYDKGGQVFGYDLTCATMSTIIKYPRASLEVDPSRGLSFKKIGYFQSEAHTFAAIREACGTGEARHPLVFLLEAADDIAYMAADVEDGVKKEAVSLSLILDYLRDHLRSAEGVALLAKVERQRARINRDYPRRDELTVQWLRIFAQQLLMEAAATSFLDHHDAILAGEHEGDLLLDGVAGELMAALKALGREHIYTHRSAVTKELAGGRALEGLLASFTDAVLDQEGGFRSRGLYAMMSANFRFIAEHFPSDPGSVYDRLLLVTDFVSGMTDSYAIEVYQRLSGIRM